MAKPELVRGNILKPKPIGPSYAIYLFWQECAQRRHSQLGKLIESRELLLKHDTNSPELDEWIDEAHDKLEFAKSMVDRFGRMKLSE